MAIVKRPYIIFAVWYSKYHLKHLYFIFSKILKDACNMFDDFPSGKFHSDSAIETDTTTERFKGRRSSNIGEGLEGESIKQKMRRSVLGYPILKRRSSENVLDENLINKTQKDETPEEKMLSQHFSEKGMAITRKTLSRLRIHILANRKLCFVGKVPRGVFMPKNYWLQYLIIKRLIFWYFPCIRFNGNSYYLNNKCYKIRERKFIKMFLKTRKLLLEAQD